MRTDQASASSNIGSAVLDALGRAGVGLCVLGPRGEVLEANAEWLRIADLADQAAIGRGIWELLPESPPEIRALYDRAWAGESVALPRRRLWVDGRELWSEGRLSPIPLGSGMGVLAMALDVTARHTEEEERKRIEQRLHQEQAFLRQVIDADTTLILVKDLENRFVLANLTAARYFGTTLEELIGRSDRDFIPLDPDGKLPPEYELLYASEREAIRTRTVVRDDVALTGADGKVRWFSSVRIPLVEDDGSCDLLLVVASDVTERKHMEEALRESDRRKSDFLAVLSHELRNPLAPIRNSLYLLERAPPGSAQATRARLVIQRQTEHLIRLVDDLLDITRIERGKVRLQREKLDLGTLVGRVAEDHRAMFERNGVELELDLGHEPISVEGDAVRLAQVVGNLLWNAAKFTPRGGCTTVRLRRADERLAEIAVRDTGEGIAPEVRAHLFEPFVQAEKTLHRSLGGLGLGLALVKGLVELHGGTVSADSPGPGRGATFSVRIPIERRAVQRLALPPEPAAGIPPQRVLVIEDNVDAADSLKDVLELNGHAVEVAHSGPDGLARARAFRPDVVLCDIGLPGMDGYEVVGALRSDPELRSAGLVALTGYGQPEDLDAAAAAGFDAHVTKPPRIETLEESMSEARAAGLRRRRGADAGESA
jgi:PAS domain S-box-containing protein